MKVLLNSREMGQLDKDTIEKYKLPSMVLMERAALGVVEFIESKDWADKSFAVICGSGNNGGDGFAVARILHQNGYHVQVIFAGNINHITQDCRLQKEICEKIGVSFVTSYEQLRNCDLFLDALFGIGLKREIQGKDGELLQFINQQKGIHIAIDIPSGVFADDGMVSQNAFLADYTVTFSYEKIGQRLYPGKAYCGILIQKEIGICSSETSLFHANVKMIEETDLKLLPTENPNANKGTMGKVLLIAGSDEMAGAAYLCGRAAMVCGCGMVKIYTSKRNRDVLLSLFPEAIVVGYDGFDEKQLLDLMKWATAISIGPGIGTSDLSRRLLETVVKYAEVPIVVDADGLNIIADNPQILAQPHVEMVLTPHIVEMARLTDNPTLYVSEHKLALCQEYATSHQVICVLKDGATLVSIPYGDTYINPTGSTALATAGSGDVLTGIITSLIAQGQKPKLAAPLGVYLHGMAGDVAAMEHSRHGLLASDIMQGIKKIYVERGL